jgi:Pycsar effector protein
VTERTTIISHFRRHRQDVTPRLNLDDAWKMLALVTDWIRHAEAKAAAALAAAGVSGGTLYGLVRGTRHISMWFAFGAGTSAVLLFVTGIFAAMALWPRLNLAKGKNNVIYFYDISREHRTHPGSYVARLRALTPDDLIDELAAQVWANSRVASLKYRWAGVAIASLLPALLALATAAALATIGL